LFALVTGATGCLGRHIVRQLLNNGHRVRALCRNPASGCLPLDGADHPGAPLEVEIAQGDVRDPAAIDKAVRGVDTVFHTAGLAGMWGPWKAFHATNVVGTQNVLDVSRHYRVRRLVYTSSPSVVFTETDQCGDDESISYARRWLCHYPRSKAAAEQAVLAANTTGGLSTCAIRPHLIWGPGDRQLLPRLLRRARTGRLRRVGDGQNLIDIIYVENAASAHVAATAALADGSPVCGRAYFVSQGEPVNCWQWIDQLLAAASLPPVKRSIPLNRAWPLGHAWEAAYRLLRLRGEPPMTRFLAAQLGRSHWFDISAARRDFGYQPTVSTAEGMERLRAWLAKSRDSRCEETVIAS
jgi:nucleoside-diphosphate-sugar epimerase